MKSVFRGAGAGGRGLMRRGLYLAPLACLAIVSAALWMPATAAASFATDIGQIQINGSAPNADGTGLQVSASITLPQGPSPTAAGYLPPDTTQLTVTNQSSSYTDIKEVDGVGNSSPLPLNSVTTSTTGTTCTADGTGAFKCTGLIVPPGQSVLIYLSNREPNGPQTDFGFGLASLNVIYDSIEVNGSPMNPHGQGLQVTAITKPGSCPDLVYTTAYCLTVIDLPSSGAPMGAVTLDPNSPPANANSSPLSDVHSEFGFGFSLGDPQFCDPDAVGGFNCPAPFGVPTQVYGFDFADPSFAGGLGDIHVDFAPTPCANTARANSMPAIARMAKLNCKPPSHTKITQAIISHKKKQAFFRFTAHGTKKFICDLMLNGHPLHYKACTSPKFYANKLKKGHYLFYVDGTNQGGNDAKPAKWKFAMK